jgi:hypothetical protein
VWTNATVASFTHPLLEGTAPGLERNVKFGVNGRSKAKNGAAFSYQFGYQLAIETVQKTSIFATGATRFGTEGSEVQILSPRPIKTGRNSMRRPSNLEGFFHLYVHRWGTSGDAGASGASWMLSCQFGCHLQL